MVLRKPVKILVGVGTAWIILYPILFIAGWFLMVTGFMFGESTELPYFLPTLFPLIFPLHCLTILIQFALMGFYLYHVIKNTTASEVLRVILGIGTFFMPYIAMPIYYYLYIWREDPLDWSVAQPAEPAEADEAEVEISTPRPISTTTKTGISKQTVAIIVGIGMVLVLFFLIFVFVLAGFMSNLNQRMREESIRAEMMQEEMFVEPTPVVYEQLPTYNAEEKPFYQPVEGAAFRQLNLFKGLSTWSDYNKIPLAVISDTLFFSGYVQDPEYDWGRTNVDLVSAEVHTGKVNWQNLAGSAFLLKDANHIYAQSRQADGATGVTAYHIDSGEVAWQRDFDYEYLSVR